MTITLAQPSKLLAVTEASDSPEPSPSAIAERLGEYFDALTGIDRFNGVVLWAQGNQVLLHRAYTMRDLPDAGAIELGSSFHIASIRKLFSEWLIRDAAERGELQLDDPVSRYFPYFPRGEEITIRHLLDHQSGLSRGESFQFEPRHYPIEDYLELIASHPLEFEPGTRTRYSNFGYMMIDLILQEATALHPADLIERRIFQRVGMPQSFEFHRRPEKLPIAIGLYEQEDQLHPVRDLDVAQFETGNIYSTSTDLLAFLRHPAVTENLARNESIAHAGGKKGYRSWVHHDIARDRTLIVLSNLATTPIQRVIDETGAILKGEEVPLPRRIKRQRVEVPRETLERYVGRYRVIANGQILDVRLEEEGLVIYEVTEEGPVDPQPIHPEAHNVFYIKADSSDSISFVEPSESAAPQMRLSIMGGFELDTERLSDAP
ncbi:serine hydrolase domain-containing protein [Wenzhouxiangella sediminis]|nr:serine hydrolase domain-containing protein [Wenzhouxiangella sediminis]